MEKDKKDVQNGINLEKLKVMTTEDLTMETQPEVNSDGNLSATIEFSRDMSAIKSTPSKIVATYTNDQGVTSAKSEIVGMGNAESDNYAVWSFDVHGWEDVGRFQEVQIWENDIMIQTFASDGAHLVQLKKGSRVVIKLIDKEDMDKYRYYEKEAIFEIRDMIADESVIDIDQLTIGVELNMDSVKEDRHFRMYYFDMRTLYSEPNGCAAKHEKMDTYDANKAKPEIPKLYYVTYNRCQTDILKVALVEPEIYDNLYDENGDWNPDKLCESLGKDPEDKTDWLKWIIANVEPVKDVDIKLIQDHGTNIIWEVMPKFDATSNKEQVREIALFTSYGRIQFARKFKIKYIPKKKSLFRQGGSR